MKIVNVSSRVVAIGTTIVMPDKSAEISEMTPGIEALVDAGFITVDDSAEKAAKAAKAEAEAKAKADEAKAKAATEKAVKTAKANADK